LEKDFTGYPTQSFSLGEDAWYYVTRRGLEICIPRVPGGAGEIQYTIPWRRVLAAASHHGKAKIKQAARVTARRRR
jgi:hypothetical protein